MADQAAVLRALVDFMEELTFDVLTDRGDPRHARRINKLKAVKKMISQAHGGPVQGYTDTQGITVRFTSAAKDVLERRAQRTGRSVSDLVQRALQREEWWEQQAAAGNTVWVQQRDGQFKQIAIE